MGFVGLVGGWGGCWGAIRGGLGCVDVLLDERMGKYREERWRHEEGEGMEVGLGGEMGQGRVVMR